MTSALRGISPKAHTSTDMLRDHDSDKRGKGSKIQKKLRTSSVNSPECEWCVRDVRQQKKVVPSSGKMGNVGQRKAREKSDSL